MEHVVELRHREGVRVELRGHFDQFPPKEIKPLTLKSAARDELIVFVGRPEFPPRRTRLLDGNRHS
jgi:hypothetical protein